RPASVRVTISSAKRAMQWFGEHRAADCRIAPGTQARKVTSNHSRSWSSRFGAGSWFPKAAVSCLKRIEEPEY
ncbi:MAG: hypothetical protein ACRD8U_04405, partial [Pyrinomonadaceae bacterium]